jgi:WD40 repeat protein
MASRIFTTWIVLALVWAGRAPVRCAEPPASPDFTADIAPILNKYCVSCHNAVDLEGELSLESFGDIQKGGSRGPAILPGEPDSSRLVRVLTGQAKPAMPPEENEAPQPQEIELLRAWIKAGARGPSGDEPDRRTLRTPRIEPSAGLPRPVGAVDYSSDNKYLAVARFGQVELLTADSHQPVRTFKDQPGKVNAVTFTGGGELLVAASGITGLYGEVRVWNVADGRLLRTLTGHRDTLYAAVPSPNGQHVATAGYDGQIILWDLASGEQLRNFVGHNGAVFDLAFSPDGRVLASASADQTIKLWNVQRGERLDTLGQPLKEQYAVVFSPDGRHVVAGGADNRIRVWRLISEEEPKINPIQFARYAHEGPIVQLAFSPDGKRLISIGEDEAVKLWETETYTVVRVYPSQPDATPALAIAPDGKHFAVGRADGSIGVYEISDSTELGGAPSDTNPPFAPAHVDLESVSKAVEVEPNDTLETATLLTIPAQVAGIIHVTRSDQPRDEDLYRFSCRAGQTWMLDVDAARSGSPLDSHVSVLHADGRPVVRMLLQAVRDSYVAFRGGSSLQNGVRLHNWEEMELNQYVYRKGEVNRIFRMPEGPDSDILVYTSAGSRRCYFDTTASAYALGEPCYIVEPQPLGARLVPNGLPVFPIYYENDDDALRTWGTDSRLTFTAPEEGEYLVRVGDARGAEGAELKYTLTLRQPKPDFEVKLHDIDPTVNRGSGKEFRVSLERIDGFDGEVQVQVKGLPPGFAATSPVVIQAGHEEAYGLIHADSSAPEPTAENAKTSQVTATAWIEGQSITKAVNPLGEIKLGPEPKLRVQLAASGQPPSDAGSAREPLTLVIAPGQTITAELHLERINFADRVSFDARNLPHGVIVDNIGLNGVLIPEGQQHRTVFLTAAKWVPTTERTFFFRSREADGQTTQPVLLCIRPPSASSTGDQRDAANGGR